MNFFHHKGLGNHLLQLCPKVVKHPVLEKTVLFSHVNTLLSHTKSSRLILFRETAVYFETHMQLKNTSVGRHSTVV